MWVLGRTHYGINRGYIGSGNAYVPSRGNVTMLEGTCKQPSTTVVFTEARSGNEGLTWFLWSGDPMGNICTTRHGTSCNVAWVDGHVTTMQNATHEFRGENVFKYLHPEQD